GTRRAAVVTYANCEFVTVNLGGLGIDERHFDARTHAFVGARRGTDHSLTCGASLVFSIQAGVLPPDDCEVAKIDFPCFAGADASASPPFVPLSRASRRPQR
ncbi:MAG: hypothetical protein ABW133_08325, partial [Polyangiaceae bacterium]